jgi:hypothetical protein
MSPAETDSAPEGDQASENASFASLFPMLYPGASVGDDTIWDQAWFILDTNVLLDLYKYRKTQVTTILTALRQLKSQLRMPYQVALEYMRRRRDIVKKPETLYQEVEIEITKGLKSLEDLLSAFEKYRAVGTKAIVKRLKAAGEMEKARLRNLKPRHPKYEEDDVILAAIEAIFEGRFLRQPTATMLAERYQRAMVRINLKIPPGLKDAGKSANSIGDILIWFEIMELAQQTRRPIIFVTNEEKSDWWDKEGGLAPKLDLAVELHQCAGVGLSMMHLDTFIEEAKRVRKLTAPVAKIEKVVTEIKQVKAEEEEAQKDRNIAIADAFAALRRGAVLFAEQEPTPGFAETLASLASTRGIDSILAQSEQSQHMARTLLRDLQTQSYLQRAMEGVARYEWMNENTQPFQALGAGLEAAAAAAEAVLSRQPAFDILEGAQKEIDRQKSLLQAFSDRPTRASLIGAVGEIDPVGKVADMAQHTPHLDASAEAGDTTSETDEEPGTEQ